MDRRLIVLIQLGYTQTVKAAVREKRRLSDVEKPQEGDE